MDKSLAPALELDKTSLQFRVGFNPPTARRFADLGTAHGICPRDLRNMIREIDGLLPRMDYGNLNGKPNPNNGRAFHTYAIGKEYSRALYLSAPKLYAKGFNFDGLTAQLKTLANKYGCEEFNTEENTPYSYLVRFWWD